MLLFLFRIDSIGKKRKEAEEGDGNANGVRKSTRLAVNQNSSRMVNNGVLSKGVASTAKDEEEEFNSGIFNITAYCALIVPVVLIHSYY